MASIKSYFYKAAGKLGMVDVTKSLITEAGNGHIGTVQVLKQAATKQANGLAPA